MRYILQPIRTAGGTGFFAPQPEGDPDWPTALRQLRRIPLDSFLHQYLLRLLLALPAAQRDALARNAESGDTLVQALLAEARYLAEEPETGVRPASEADDAALIAATPLIFLRHRRMADREWHRYWIGKLAANILEHKPLALFGEEGHRLPPLSPGETTGKSMEIASIPPCAQAPADNLPDIGEIIRTAHQRLAAHQILVSSEMRHESSLSPVALMRQWRLERRVQSGTLNYRLGGFMTAYGRGLALDQARVSCLMEIVERYSAFGEFQEEVVAGHAVPVPLRHGRSEELRQSGLRVLNIEDLELEAPCRDAALYWRPARIVEPSGGAEIWVPAQCVYLFCNLDEPDLFSALGSTGLAAGRTMAEACLSALLEIVERDAVSTTLFDPADCFTLDAEDSRLKELFAHYRQLGIRIQFQDLTGALGIPCYKCFVIDSQGQIAKGTGAHLDGRRALLSALTETMYPYPNAPASHPGLQDLPMRPLSDLPDHACGSVAGDLDRVERLLTANGFSPIYADLTRSDLGLPAVRAIVPGLTVMADFDRFSPLTKRLVGALHSAPSLRWQGVDSL